jgi:hypothetical protein
MDLRAVFTGDSSNYHIFQVVDSEDCVGSIYIKKKSTNGVPEALEINLVTPIRDKFLWTKGLEELIEKAREGSKAKHKLVKTLKSYK